MKRILILSAAIITLSYSSSMAQKIGIRGGYSLTNWKGYVLANADFESEALSGFHLGLYGQVGLTGSIRLEPGIFYSRKGAGGSFEDGSNEYLIENQASYLDVPLLIRIYFGGFNLHAGPQVGLLLTNEIVATVTDINSGQNASTTTKTEDQFNDTAVDLVLGLGYEFNNGLNFSVTYDIGVTNILIDEDALQTEGVSGSYYSWLEAQNRVLKFSLGVTF